MTKEFIPYEQALALKKLGFDEPCFGYYSEQGNYILEEGKVNSNCNKPGMNSRYCTAPTYSQAFRWFREKYGYYYEIFVDDDKTFGFLISYFLEIGRANKPIQRKYATYEEAELECLIKLIEIVKTK